MIDATVVIAGESQSRVALTEASADLLRLLWDKHGPLMFHQSGGCCDGSSPMCYPAGEFYTSAADVLLGTFDIGPATLPGTGSDAGTDTGTEPTQPIDFWMSREQFAYWSHTHLTVDVVPGRGSGFSVESPEGLRFLIRSKLMDDARPFR